MSNLLGSLFCGVSCIVVVGFLIVVGIVLITRNKKKSQQAAVINPGWLSVTGKILSSELEEDDEGIISPVISFEYTINGQVYTSSQVVGKPNNIKSKALKTLELYPLESEIEVKYYLEEPGKGRVQLR